MFERINNNVKVKSKVRHEMLEDRPHVVVNTVMIMEGVWPGSGGAIFYPGKQLKRSVPTWNHKPALIYHPDMGNSPLSGCSPKIINNQKCGLILETRCGTDTKLKSETWFDEKRLKKVDEPTLERIENGEIVEVSTGVILEHDGKKGIWNGKKFVASAFNLVGDHLAILPKGVGACSVRDGAGLHQNQDAYIQKMIKFLVNKGISHPFMLNLNELSHSQIHSSLTMAIRSKLESTGNRWDGWIEEVFDDYVIFYAGGSLFKIGYKAKDSGVEITSEMQAVKRSTQYTAIKNEQLVSNEETKGDNMSDKKKVVVDSLIANGWNEADRETLMGFEETALEKLSALKSITKSPPVQQPAVSQPAVVANSGQQVKAPEKELTFNELLEKADPATRYFLQEGALMYNQRMEELVTIITNCPNNAFTKEELLAKFDRLDLEKMAATLRPQQPVTNNGYLPRGNFAGAAGSAPVNNNHVQKPMGAPRIIGRVENKKTA